MRTAKWKPGEFKIAYRGARGGKLWEITSGQIWSIWGVDKRHLGWYLTHCPSGYSICSPYSSAAEAKAVAKYLDGVRGIKSLTGITILRKKPDLKRRISAILDAKGKATV